MKLYFFTSTRKADKCGTITIATQNEKRARLLACVKFLEWGYKGEPKLAL